MGYIISKIKKPCAVCGKITNRIEYHYEAYICSQECEDVLNEELLNSMNDTDGMTKQEFERKCYEAYKINWMLEHGETLTNMFDVISNIIYQNHCDSADLAMAIFTDDVGFKDGIWVCKEEFLGNEFVDPEYMHELFLKMPDSYDMEQFYYDNYI